MSVRAGDEGGRGACEPAARRKSHARARGRCDRRAQPPDNRRRYPNFTNVKRQACRRVHMVCQDGINRSKSECYMRFFGSFSDKVTCVSTYTHSPCGNGGQPFTNVNGMVYKCKHLYTNVNSCRCNHSQM